MTRKAPLRVEAGPHVPPDARRPGKYANIPGKILEGGGKRHNRRSTE